MYTFIGASLSEPHTSKSLTQVSYACHQPSVNNYRENQKTHNCPCHGEIHNVDYMTFLFVWCRLPYHGESHGIDLQDFLICVASLIVPHYVRCRLQDTYRDRTMIDRRWTEKKGYKGRGTLYR